MNSCECQTIDWRWILREIDKLESPFAGGLKTSTGNSHMLRMRWIHANTTNQTLYSFFFFLTVDGGRILREIDKLQSSFAGLLKTLT